MTLYAQYILEREGKEVIEDERGFISFGVYGEECFINDAFIAKEFRLSGVGSFFVDEVSRIAKERGCKLLTCSVIPSALNSTDSAKAILSYGFKIHSSQANKVLFFKELQ